MAAAAAAAAATSIRQWYHSVVTINLIQGRAYTRRHVEDIVERLVGLGATNVAGQLERAPGTGNIHGQFYVGVPRKLALGGWRRLLRSALDAAGEDLADASAHIEYAHNGGAAWDYASKEETYVPDTRVLRGRRPGGRHEAALRASNSQAQQRQSFTQQVHSRVIAGVPLADILRDADLGPRALFSSGQLRNATAILGEGKERSRRAPPPKLWILYGASGSGKSHLAYALADASGGRVYVKGTGTHWFDDYCTSGNRGPPPEEGQRDARPHTVILFDEYSVEAYTKQFGVDWFLKAADKWGAIRFSRRGIHDISLGEYCDHIVVTSNINPDAAFRWAPEQKAAISRRMREFGGGLVYFSGRGDGGHSLVNFEAGGPDGLGKCAVLLRLHGSPDVELCRDGDLLSTWVHEYARPAALLPAAVVQAGSSEEEVRLHHGDEGSRTGRRDARAVRVLGADHPRDSEGDSVASLRVGREAAAFRFDGPEAGSHADSDGASVHSGPSVWSDLIRDSSVRDGDLDGGGDLQRSRHGDAGGGAEDH
jgi:hypothetical protein